MVGHISRRINGGYGALILAACITLGATLSVGVLRSRPAAAQHVSKHMMSQKTSTSLLTAQAVLAAFTAANLPAGNVRQLEVGGNPSDPPATESAAWTFSVPDVAPSGGHILVFSSSQKLGKKSDWFVNRAHVSITSYRNVILWLDPRMAPQEANLYREALRGLK